MANEKNHTRKAKRSFSGNKFQKASDNKIVDSTLLKKSCSARKLSKFKLNVKQCSDDFNMIIYFPILKEILMQVGSCPDCQNGVTINNDDSKRMGFSHSLKIKCAYCSYEWCTFTSSTVDNNTKNKGRSPFDINLRMAVAFREIGQGHEPMSRFAYIANISCMNVNAFQRNHKLIQAAYDSAAKDCMKFAANEIKANAIEISPTGVPLIQVSLDGTWQKRGHSSLNGVVTAISGGRCVDADVLSRYCRGCQIWFNRKQHPGYENWKTNHNCSLNHTNLSGAMEKVGALNIFQRSLELYGLIYKYYLGDGDSSSFNYVAESDPYADNNIKPQKLECIGHIQKRIGTRLRNRRKERHEGLKLTGKNNLTERAVNFIQNYFGMAIRQTANNSKLDDTQKVYQMKKNIRAVLFHCTNFESQSHRHVLCPVGPESWCKWKKSEGDQGNDSYIPKVNLPIWIHDIILSDFNDLSDDRLLNKCVHGETQNCNEGINNIIWSKCPKNVFVKKGTLEIGVNSAILSFNEGTSGLKRVFEYLNIVHSGKTVAGSLKKDKRRVDNMERKEKTINKKRRIQLRGFSKGWFDKEQELEAKKSYASGSF